jgi:single-stranded DNA-specific DHH superfamily exonuclease
LGFTLGPRLNAAGRLDDMSLGIACLLSGTESQAMTLAQELDRLNRERRVIEHGMQDEAWRCYPASIRQTATPLPCTGMTGIRALSVLLPRA